MFLTQLNLYFGKYGMCLSMLTFFDIFKESFWAQICNNAATSGQLIETAIWIN